MMGVDGLRPRAMFSCMLLSAGCAWHSGEVGSGPDLQSGPIEHRRATVIAETCLLTASQLEALKQTATHVRQVVLVCAQATDTGAVRLVGDAPPAALQDQTVMLRALGMQPRIGLTYGAGPGMPGNPQQVSSRLADAVWRTTVIQNLAQLDCDGFEVALPELDNAARGALTAFVAELSNAAPLDRAVGVFAPPSMTSPSDLPGGDAYDLLALRPHVDRVRLMTLDYSCCGAPAGPTLEPWWVSSVARLAGGALPETMLDITVPLYGVHFSSSGLQYVSHAEAIGLAEIHHAQLQRGEWNTPFFAFDDQAGWHTIWFDDRVSTLTYLRLWNPPEIPAGVGITFYGLGAEDPGLWQAWQEAQR